MKKTQKVDSSSAAEFSRRMFLQLGLWITGAVSSWVLFKFLSYDPPREELESSVMLDPPTLYQLGSANYIPEVRAWLIRDEEGIYAVSSTCTHLGCLVNQEAESFVCPCHGSQFDLSGKVLQGPASTPLDHFDVSLSDDGRVIVDRRVTVPRTTRLRVNS
jgi:nitrite reductase/ring-hydroxylating ferredoxin subunit